MKPAGFIAVAVGGLGFLASVVAGGGGTPVGAIAAGLLNPAFFLGVPLGIYWLYRSGIFGGKSSGPPPNVKAPAPSPQPSPSKTPSPLKATAPPQSPPKESSASAPAKRGPNLSWVEFWACLLPFAFLSSAVGVAVSLSYQSRSADSLPSGQWESTEAARANRQLQNRVTELDGANRALQTQVAELEREKRRLQARVTDLEGENRGLSQQRNELQQRGQNQSKWRQIRLGLSKSEVRRILGEPVRVQRSYEIESWEYSDEGIDGPYVWFQRGDLVTSWQEPKW